MVFEALALLSLTAGCGRAFDGAPIEVYFIRHGETVANATGRYSASTIDTLTSIGVAQAHAVAQVLRRVAFDLAVVSPSPRAELTAEETIREHHMTATIWPELNECCTEHGAARLKPPSKVLQRGAKVSIRPTLAGVLRIDPTDDRMYAPANYADGLRQTQIAADRCRALLAHRPWQRGNYRILVVGHSAQGSRFLDFLLGRKPVGDIEVKNGEIFVLRAEPGGPFKLARKIENPNQSKRVDPRMR